MAKPTPQSSCNRRVSRHLQIVAPIAQHYASRSGQDRDDLFQVGCLGLIRASALFKPRKEIPFECFARPHIRGAILHYLRDSIGLVRLPRRIQEQAQRTIEREQAKSWNSQRPSTPEEQWAMHTYRLQGQWEQLNDSEQFHTPGCWNQRGWTELMNEEQRERLQRLWKELPDMERRCVWHVVIQGQSLRGTARQLGTSAMTVQRRVKQGLCCLARRYHNGGESQGSSAVSPEHRPVRFDPQAC